MKRTWVVIAVLAFLFGVLAFLFVSGYLSRLVAGGQTIPPCETLPSSAEVSRAIEEQPALVKQITATGGGVQIVVATPCDDPDAAVLEVRVNNDEEESRVDKVLTESDGFGVPVVIDRR